MSASLIVLIPLVLVGLVGALCFVGCAFPTHGLGPTLGPYATAISQINGLVALWPLNDTLLGTIVPSAVDVAPTTSFNGTYTGTSGSTFTLNQPSIVLGDAGGGASVLLNGGFVNVSFEQALNPASFTVEAWVLPHWNADEAMTNRGVVLSLNTPQSVGWALSATSDNFWAATVGTGPNPPPGPNTFAVKSAQSIILDGVTVYYLAMTFDGGTGILTLYVGTMAGGLVSSASSPNMPINYVQEQQPPSPQPSTATPLFIGMGRPDLTNGMFPLNGFVQDVAVYNVALGLPIITNNFNLGINPPPDT